MGKWMDGHMDGWTDRWIEKWTVGWMNGLMESSVPWPPCKLISVSLTGEGVRVSSRGREPGVSGKVGGVHLQKGRLGGGRGGRVPPFTLICLALDALASSRVCRAPRSHGGLTCVRSSGCSSHVARGQIGPHPSRCSGDVGVSRCHLASEIGFRRQAGLAGARSSSLGLYSRVTTGEAKDDRHSSYPGARAALPAEALEEDPSRVSFPATDGGRQSLVSNLWPVLMRCVS